MSLVDRVKARQLAESNPEFQSYAKNMEEASKAMTESAQKLRAQKFQEALTPEQQGWVQAAAAEVNTKVPALAIDLEHKSGAKLQKIGVKFVALKRVGWEVDDEGERIMIG